MAKRISIAAALLCAAVLCNGTVHAGERSMVMAEDLRAAVRAYLAGREAHQAEDLDLSFRSVPDSIGIDSPAFTLRVGMGSSNRSRGPVAFVVEVVAGEQTVRRCMVTAVIRTYDTVLVADRTLQRGVTPVEEDVRRLKIETTGIDRPVVTTLADIEGRRTRRAITRGSLFYQDMFEEQPLVHKGSQVNVLVRSGAVSVTAEGVACQDGKAGDLIEVTVQGKAGRLKARVANDHTVAILAD